MSHRLNIDLSLHKSLQTDAAAVGNAIARTKLFARRESRARIGTDRQWLTRFVGRSCQFSNGAERLLDAWITNGAQPYCRFVFRRDAYAGTNASGYQAAMARACARAWR